MILYTMMPHELIFTSEAQEFGRQRTVIFNGIPLLVELEDDHSFRIIRILSSDPKHYLDSRCKPGEKISYF
ncbi:ribonuclease [Bacillus methanolicus]|uniref:YlzJ-like family protein n=1 Tax=Bacillus methanolicus TaxID=1471 RepID=UPI00200EC276|nr:YlzJ-like family protein [Bacillus methanolicus]UQD51760.1 ribonuclease [Bacillus methanolicus]